MAIKVKSKTETKTPSKVAPKSKVQELKEQAVNNTTIVKTKVNEEPVVEKEGLPLEHAPKHKVTNNVTNPKTVGVNVGSTINMGDYQSLRIDCWLTDEVQDNENHLQSLARITEIAFAHVESMASNYKPSK